MRNVFDDTDAKYGKICNPYDKSVYFPGCNLENHNLLVAHMKEVMDMYF